MDTEAELARLRYACQKNDNDIEQVLGRALGYPRYCDDQTNFPGSTDADGVCVGDQVAASLALQAADRIKALATELEQARADVDAWKKLYFDAGRSNDAFAADMARLMVGVFKKDEELLKERDAAKDLSERQRRTIRALVVAARVMWRYIVYIHKWLGSPKSTAVNTIMQEIAWGPVGDQNRR